MPVRALAVLVAAGFLLAVVVEAPAAGAAEASAFQKPASAVKSAISANLGCSWRPHLEASEQCGDELVVLNRGADGKVESVELTCPVSPRGKAVARCRRQAAWIVSAFLPLWPGRDRWVAQLFQSPPRKGRWIKASVGAATVLAQTEGPADLDAADIVLGVTQGDPQSWDLPR